MNSLRIGMVESITVLSGVLFIFSIMGVVNPDNPDRLFSFIGLVVSVAWLCLFVYANYQYNPKKGKKK